MAVRFIGGKNRSIEYGKIYFYMIFGQNRNNVHSYIKQPIIRLNFSTFLKSIQKPIISLNFTHFAFKM
jgi:hypothetical protein